MLGSMSDSVRPEVVDRIVAALVSFDPASLEDLGPVTPEEQAAAEERAAEQLESRRSRSNDYLRVWQIVQESGVDLGKRPRWRQVFDALSPEQVERIRPLYHSLDDVGRAEFDKRFGRPGA